MLFLRHHYSDTINLRQQFMIKLIQHNQPRAVPS
nr:MAG TPA: hypothetical protein [Caudoviricetes sp.]